MDDEVQRFRVRCLELAKQPTIQRIDLLLLEQELSELEQIGYASDFLQRYYKLVAGRFNRSSFLAEDSLEARRARAFDSHNALESRLSPASNS